MWLGSKFTLVSDSLFRSLFKFLFRYDIFISYARGDGKEYALKLRDQLKQLDFSCFLDFDELPPGNALNNTLKRAIRKSAALVIVGTERAVKSRYVELEVGEFGKTGRAIIPIDIEGTLAQTPWSVIKERDIVWIDEVQTALVKGVPSPTVADSIDKLFKYTRRNTRVRAQVLATMILFILVVAVSLFMIQQKVKAANFASTEAERQKTLANTASIKAEERQKAADEASGRARVAEANANTALTKAATAEQAAKDSATRAKEQEQKALASAKVAKQQQTIAEERTNYLQAQQIGVQADIDIDRGDDLERSALLSLESLNRALTPDGYISWARAMELLPHPSAMKFVAQPENVTAVAYSSDGRYFAQGTDNGAVTFFRTDKTAEAVERHLHSAIKIITFGNDWVAAASASEFQMWGLNGFKEIRSSKTLNGFHGQSVAFSPDGRYVATASPVGAKGVLGLFDITNSSTVFRKPIDHVGYIMSVAFSPDGRWLALGCHYKAYEEPRSTANASEVLDQSATVGRIIFLEVENFQKGGDIAGKPAAWVNEQALIYRVAFGPKGEHFATEDTKGVVRMWQVLDSDGQIKLKRQQSQNARGAGLNNFANYGQSTLVFSPDESYIATAPDKNTARVWEVSSGNEVSRIMHQTQVEAIAFSPKGQFATTSGQVKFWKTEFGIETTQFSNDDKSTDSRLSAIAVSPAGEWLVMASDDGVHVFSTKDWSPIAWLARGSPVSRITFNPDGHWLIAAGESKVTLIETKTLKTRELFSQSADESPKLAALGFSPDGRKLVIAYGSFVKLVEVGSWVEARTIAANGPVRVVAFSPDSRSLAVEVESATYITSHQRAPSEIHLWNTTTGVPLTCRDDGKGASSESEPEQTLTFSEKDVCFKAPGAGPEVQLSEVRKWKTPWESNRLVSESPDGRWSVDSTDGLRLIFKGGEVPRQVAKLIQDGNTDWTFTPDSRWLVIRGGSQAELWPLGTTLMIEAACARLRRHELADKEWRFSGQKLQPCSSTKP